MHALSLMSSAHLLKPLLDYLTRFLICYLFCITALFVINLSSICAFNLWWYLTTYNLLIEGYMFDESAFFAKSSTKILFYTRTPSKAIYCYFHIVFCYWKQLYYCTSRSLSVIFLKKHAWTLHLLSTIQR